MRLEEHEIFIDKVEFGDETVVSGHSLIINKQELIKLISDERFSKVEVELAVPGENCRIVRVADIIEPRVKKSGGGQVFPGVLSEMSSIGSGETVCLKGVTVMETWQMPSQQVMMIDMNGPAAELSEFSRTNNVVLVLQPSDNISPANYAQALKQASLKTAVYLAQAAKNIKPDNINIYENQATISDDLPRVAFVCQLLSHKEMEETLVYGHNSRNIIPTVIHPNEFFDGAVVNFQYEVLANSEVTYTYQNNPIVKELYKRHGVDLNFVGVILKDAPFSIADKKRSSMVTANLAKWVLNLDGLILSKEGGGHPMVDLGLICESCEEQGIKTVILLSEYLSVSASNEQGIILNSRKADALVSCGMLEKIKILRPERLIGDKVLEDSELEKQLNSINAVMDSVRHGGFIHNRLIRGAISQLGESYLTTVEY